VFVGRGGGAGGWAIRESGKARERRSRGIMVDNDAGVRITTEAGREGAEEIKSGIINGPKNGKTI
jgi:hypothetical protein